MSPEEVLGKFVSRRMMIKEARYVDDALNGPIHEPQPIALKATRSKEALPSKVAQVKAAEWDSDCSSSDSENEGLAATAFNKSSLFPNERHTCLMAKEKK
jgi:hypothetical protein